jgi:hypothetical protein
MAYMLMLPRSTSVRRVVKLKRSQSGGYIPMELLDAGKKKKRVSKEYRPLAKILRRLARAEATFGAAYLSRHERSAKRKKNGFAKDLGKNIRYAVRKARREYKNEDDL